MSSIFRGRPTGRLSTPGIISSGMLIHQAELRHAANKVLSFLLLRLPFSVEVPTEDLPAGFAHDHLPRWLGVATTAIVGSRGGLLPPEVDITAAPGEGAV